jgi:dipeptidase
MVIRLYSMKNTDPVFRLNETIPKKRIYLSIKVPSSGDYSGVLPLFQYFLRLPDNLAQSAHFRPEVIRTIRITREDAVKHLQKADEEEKAAERALEREKAKKLKRDLELKGLSAAEQKKYLEKEKKQELKRDQKKMQRKG